MSSIFCVFSFLPNSEINMWAELQHLAFFPHWINRTACFYNNNINQTFVQTVYRKKHSLRFIRQCLCTGRAWQDCVRVRVRVRVLTVCGRKRFLILFLSFGPWTPFITTVRLLSLQHTPAFAAHHALYWTPFRKTHKAQQRQHTSNKQLHRFIYDNTVSIHTAISKHPQTASKSTFKLIVLSRTPDTKHSRNVLAFKRYERTQGLQSLDTSPNLEYQTRWGRKQGRESENERKRAQSVRLWCPRPAHAVLAAGRDKELTFSASFFVPSRHQFT